MLIEILKNIGFESLESQIYLILQRFGSRPASFVARKLAMNRITIYQYLKRLTYKGIVRIHVRSGIQYFTSEPIDALCSYIDNQKNTLDKQLNILKSHQHLFSNIQVCSESSSPSEVLYGLRTASSCVSKIKNSSGPLIIAGSLHGFSDNMNIFCELLSCHSFTRRIRKLCLDTFSSSKYLPLISQSLRKKVSTLKASLLPQGMFVCVLAYEVYIFEMEDEKIRIMHITSTAFVSLLREAIISM